MLSKIPPSSLLSKTQGSHKEKKNSSFIQQGNPLAGKENQSHVELWLIVTGLDTSLNSVKFCMYDSTGHQRFSSCLYCLECCPTLQLHYFQRKEGVSSMTEVHNQESGDTASLSRPTSRWQVGFTARFTSGSITLCEQPSRHQWPWVVLKTQRSLLILFVSPLVFGFYDWENEITLLVGFNSWTL